MKASFGYGQCRKNHNFFAPSPVYDGCLEYLGGTDNLHCEVCGCHRNFHDIPRSLVSYENHVEISREVRFVSPELEGIACLVDQDHERRYIQGQTGSASTKHDMTNDDRTKTESATGNEQLYTEITKYGSNEQVNEALLCKQDFGTSPTKFCDDGGDNLSSQKCHPPSEVISAMTSATAVKPFTPSVLFCDTTQVGVPPGDLDTCYAQGLQAIKKPRISVKVEGNFQVGEEHMLSPLRNTENMISARTIAPKPVFSCRALSRSAYLQMMQHTVEVEGDGGSPPERLGRAFHRLQLLYPKELLELKFVHGEWKVSCGACSKLLSVDPNGSSVNNIKQHFRSQYHRFNVELMLSWAPCK